MAVPPVTAIPTVIAVPKASADAMAIATQAVITCLRVVLRARLSADTVISEVKSVISTVQPIGHFYLR